MEIISFEQKNGYHGQAYVYAKKYQSTRGHKSYALRSINFHVRYTLRCDIPLEKTVISCNTFPWSGPMVWNTKQTCSINSH